MTTQVGGALERPTRRLIAVGVRGEMRAAPGLTKGPRPCPGCLGEGVLLRRPCRHMGVCPCDPDEIPCESCGGAGTVQCEYCGEDCGTVQTPHGLYCRGCAVEVDRG